ncbi:MAG TPA: TraX protein [Proteiniclasticum sp.]|uniref:TraX family protein n=1 Tax=Proteiniclasticum sp. TaxID=2053595 RepID=UPI000E8A3FA9|nr:TraX family protein [Proteiniclasticum sp.]HBW13263.1 TraX protein [Proteiniclasticum sp.]
MMKLLNSMHLKLIALITMIIDHTGAIFFSGQDLYRIIGRLAFPIYCFLLVEGFFHTKSREKYAARLFIFALISELPFDYAFFGGLNGSHQNIFFTLFLGLSGIWISESFRYKIPLVSIAGFVGAAVLATLLNTDYTILGILYILIFYFARSMPHGLKEIYILLAIGTATSFLSGSIQMYAIFAVIPIMLYNGKPGLGSRLIQYGFYAAYPVHLMILYLIQISMN